jgi:phenylacetate-CoA ligase
MLRWMSKYIFFPLWEIKDGASRGRYLCELSKSQWNRGSDYRREQWTRLQAIVEYARTHCSYYQKSLASLGPEEGLRDWSQFYMLPMLTKHDIRSNIEGLLSDEFNLSDLVEARTGGSTGTALTVYSDQVCQQMRNAAAMRSDRWAGWDIGMKVAAVWGNPPEANTIKKKMRSSLLDRTIYLDTMKIDEEAVKAFIRKWHTYQPQLIFGHAHSIYMLAKYLERLECKHIRPVGIIATSMMLLESEREAIEGILGCAVTNRYGCEEVGLIACECESHNGLHLNADHLIVEFLRADGTEAGPGEEGQIVVTDLINHGMPLIRYQVGDIGVPSARSCPCGRGLPLMERVTGRRADFLKRVDGSLVAGVSLVERTLTAIPGIEQMQLIQDDLRHVCVQVVKTQEFDVRSEQCLINELQSVFGSETTIEVRCVSSLDRTSSGKYRFSICRV